MNNLKTALIVVLLMGALYGAYQYLNQRDVPPPPEAALQMEQGIAPPEISFGAPVESFTPSSQPVRVPESGSSTFSPASFPSAPETEASAPPLAADDRSATPLAPPSFAVAPGEPEPTFDELPAADARGAREEPHGGAPPASPPVAASPTAPMTTDEQVRPAEHSAYVDSASRVAHSSSAAAPSSGNPKDPFSNLQSNPFYRPKEQPQGNVSFQTQPPRDIGRAAFHRAWNQAREQVEAGKFREALAELTIFYNSPDLDPEEHKQLVRTLDALAGRVIYSTEHYLELPYVVKSDETLMDIAARYNVEWQLLQNINGIRDPLVLIPRTELKVVRGPFRAEVNLRTSELTLFVDKYYAGRFPISIGRDPYPAEGQYTVRGKQQGKDYFPASGATISAGHPMNPYGKHWIDLGSDISIHGSAERDVSPDMGCISLSPIDAADVYGMLSPGSVVTIRR